MSKAAKKLIDAVGGRYASQLGIDLSGADPEQVFRWFLASKLFGARISADIAIKTYREFERHGVTSPEQIIKTGWDGLVKILDDGGYARYDFSTATKLLEIMRDLIDSYGGDLNKLHRSARDEKDMEDMLKGLGKGIGDVTVNIFLRELRTAWPKARPVPSEMVKQAAGHLGFTKRGENTLEALERTWAGQRVRGKDFCDFEAALLRLGKDYCKRARHDSCPMRSECKRRSAE